MTWDSFEYKGCIRVGQVVCNKISPLLDRHQLYPMGFGQGFESGRRSFPLSSPGTRVSTWWGRISAASWLGTFKGHPVRLCPGVEFVIQGKLPLVRGKGVGEPGQKGFVHIGFLQVLAGHAQKGIIFLVFNEFGKGADVVKGSGQPGLVEQIDFILRRQNVPLPGFYPPGLRFLQ